MNIVIGADPWAAQLKDAIKAHLTEQGHTVTDVGTIGDDKVDYYDVGAGVARAVQSGEAHRGIVLCGTGMGVAITANKFKGVTAGLVESAYAAKMCRAINNANVLAMGAMMMAPHQAMMAVDAFLATEHTEGLPDDLAAFLKDSLVKIAAIEDENMK
ncbi:MAG: RpiB/LacA/LacB family sugar-phosphate isomerase [Planctomycetota bacterium]|jgi:ribose 5-phosphate isomerase B